MCELSCLEKAVSAKINFGNVVEANPALAKHPHFQIAMDQLEEVIKGLEKGVDNDEENSEVD